jgi:preprotein translocase subunit SecA
MDYLKEGIGLRAMAQRDPLVEYQREGYDMFQQMMGAIKEESIGFLFNLEVEVTPAPVIDQAQLTYSAPSEDGSTEVHGAAAQNEAPAAPTQKPEAGGQGSSFFRS